ncbi:MULTISPECIES: aldo/keto reductase [Peptoniphilus]|uniref:aldo/keto reductase n=1 Tax=Peptoniphilus TaxID=162289 RepID=UPI0003B900C6|nr:MULTISPECIES: aldo/keto reductase [Peptoniphilus]ERT64950.1 4Fe-4S dicluster domain protein [Peptoniphilus sp. BV3AC2]MDK8275584.1 aldo/keto reductase [Peptoniphilus duerdenii]
MSVNFGNKLLGFGMMRLPKIVTGEKEEILYDKVCEMVDYFLENRFNYFDTAHGYHKTFSEVAVKKCLSSRHSRDKYILTNKLTAMYFEKKEDIEPLFMSQLEACGVEYFDNYLIHSVSRNNYGKYMDCEAFEVVKSLKERGFIKHIGMSFHDSAELLDKILSEHEEIEMVQIQFNYIDFDDKIVQSKACYDVCRKHNKEIIIMEPVKGGKLANLPKDARKILEDLNGGSMASYAIRFAASFEGVRMVLSGMSSLDEMKDNLSYMKDFKKINDKERKAIDRVVEILNSIDLIPCTTCEYCLEGCPQNIRIPSMISILNQKKMYETANFEHNYDLATRTNGKASECIECGHCESVCPQHIEIIDALKDVVEKIENQI